MLNILHCCQAASHHRSPRPHQDVTHPLPSFGLGAQDADLKPKLLPAADVKPVNPVNG